MAIPMRKKTWMTIVSLLSLLLFWSCISVTASDSPFIVAHKTASLSKIDSKAARISVVIDIYNRGSATAYDVSLTDNRWDEDVFDSVLGNTSRSWEKLEAGSIVSHSFELETRVKTVYHGAPALIKFRVPKVAAVKEAYSTPVLPLEILTERTLAKKIELAKSLLTTHGSKVAVVAIVALFARIISRPSKASKKKH